MLIREVSGTVMDSDTSVMFSSLIAGMLLYQREMRAIDIVNVISFFALRDIDVSDENDDMSCLYCCVSFNYKRSISLRSGFDYQTRLSNGVIVGRYLKELAGNSVLNVIKEYYGRDVPCFEDVDTLDNSGHLVRRKKRLSNMVRYSFISLFMKNGI